MIRSINAALVRGLAVVTRAVVTRAVVSRAVVSGAMVSKAVVFMVMVSATAFAEDEHQHHNMDHGMTMDATGMVMNANSDKLPEDCAEISRDYEFTVIAGTAYAEPYAGTMFGFDEHEWRVEPCSRITITFENEDEVRHQWMIHRLPKYLYDQGMFHMEAAGGHTQKGTFIVPSDDRTYLVHCDIAQHMEKGMKAQLVVGKGSGDLWSIPGVTANFEREPLTSSWRQVTFLLLIVLVVCLLTVWIVAKRKTSRSVPVAK